MEPPPLPPTLARTLTETACLDTVSAGILHALHSIFARQPVAQTLDALLNSSAAVIKPGSACSGLGCRSGLEGTSQGPLCIAYCKSLTWVVLQVGDEGLDLLCIALLDWHLPDTLTCSSAAQHHHCCTASCSAQTFATQHVLGAPVETQNRRNPCSKQVQGPEVTPAACDAARSSPASCVLSVNMPPIPGPSATKPAAVTAQNAQQALFGVCAGQWPLQQKLQSAGTSCEGTGQQTNLLAKYISKWTGPPKDICAGEGGHGNPLRCHHVNLQKSAHGWRCRRWPPRPASRRTPGCPPAPGAPPHPCSPPVCGMEVRL